MSWPDLKKQWQKLECNNVWTRQNHARYESAHLLHQPHYFE
jgi:hypothetical protein